MEQFANTGTSTLNGTIASGATSLTVLAATTFPTVGIFRIRVESEIMIVTAVSSNTFTVTRGAEGTTAAAHSSGVQVVHIVTAQALASSNWNIAFDLDLSALTTASYNTDGTFTFTGAPASTNYTWTKGNSSGSTVAVTNGSGLNFQPASSTDYNGPTRTLPFVWLPFAQVFPAASFPNFGWNTKLRMWVAMGTDNLTATFDNYVFGMDSNSTGFGCVVKRGFGTVGPQGSQNLYEINAGNTGNFTNDSYTLGAGNKTYMVEFESVSAMWFKTFRGSSLTAGQVFPSVSSLQTATINLYDVAPNTTNVSFATTGVTDPLNGMGLFLGAQRAGSGTALSVFYLRLRLDYKFQD